MIFKRMNGTFSSGEEWPANSGQKGQGNKCEIFTIGARPIIKKLRGSQWGDGSTKPM